MRALLILLLAVLPAIGLRADEPAPASLVGEWAGPVEMSEIDGLEVGQTIGMTLRGDAAGFELRWSVPLVGTAEASFVPGSHDGVYAIRTGGMFSLFSSRGPANPVSGQQLVWARTEGPVLIVYSFEIARGGAFALARYECAREGEMVMVRYTRRSGDGERALTARLSLLRG
jgi:hypothetical protein